MNKVILVGRLVSTPYKNITASNVEYSRFTLAVRRNYTTANNETIADFIPCVAWRQNAAFINKYLDKGSLILVEGSFQSQRIVNEMGQNITTYSVNVENIESLESKEISEQRRKTHENNQFNISQDISQPQSENNNDEFSNSVDNEFADLTWE